MKNKILTMLLLCTLSLAFAQAPVQIKGNFNKKNIKSVKLFQVREGDLEEIATSQPLETGKFGLLFYPSYEGFYVLGPGDKGDQNNNLVFYFKSGDQLELTITDEGYKLVGSANSKENQLMEKWSKEIYTVKQKSFNWLKTHSAFLDFFPDLELIVQKANLFARNNKSGNLAFDRILPNYIQWDVAASAANFLVTPHSTHPNKEEFSSYYKNLKTSIFGQYATSVYDLPWGKRTLYSISIAEHLVNNTPYKRDLSGLQEQIERMPNDTLKGDILLTYLTRQKDYLNYKEATNEYGRFLMTENQQRQATNIMNSMAQLKKGDQGLDFEFQDKTGKIIKFSDLKGKVILVDVWATWCGPCKQEIPFLQKLNEEIQGIDIQIVSISLDEAKDKQKWLNMIHNEGLTGMQLFASGWGDFTKYYKISGIPHFMVFDRAGKIVSIDAPRPSNPELKKLLMDTLM